ncbi:MAG: hypothetical protein AB8B47_01945 [Roseobacter sp.]
MSMSRRKSIALIGGGVIFAAAGGGGSGRDPYAADCFCALG